MESQKRQEAFKAIEHFMLQREKKAKARDVISNLTNREEGWNITQLHIVSLINEFPSDSNNSFLSEQLGLSKPAITKSIKKLIDRGVVKAEKKEDNLKTVYYTLTNDGERLARVHDELHEKVKGQYNELLHQFTENELDVIIRFMNEWAKRI
ncbi:MarR family transcriptional regulator [Bacillus atrophaeus]|uniref:MarR family transcriptional regulator n=1 Tax=Bacillus atrophaeus TaxID=1452 RepID=UPI003EB84170